MQHAATENTRTPPFDKRRDRDRSTSQIMSENASADSSPLRGRKPFGYKAQPS